MKKILALTTALLFSICAFAQIENPVKWAYAAKKTTTTDATLFLKATIEKGWHIYSQYIKEGGPIKTSFTFTPSKAYTTVGKPSEPKAVSKFDKQFAMNIGFFENEVVFQQKIKVKTPGVTQVKGQLEFMVCNDRKCLPPETVDFVVPVGK